MPLVKLADIAVGTAALAPRALGGVADPNIKVYGTTNVRVVSSSCLYGKLWLIPFVRLMRA